MQTALYHTFVEKARIQPGTAINVVMACEDPSDGRRAMRTYNGLVRELGGDCEFNYEMWKFETLQAPPSRLAAVQIAREAEMIIVATHSHTLPLSVKSWIESSLPANPNHPRALVALIAGSAEELAGAAPVFTYLRDAAARGRMEFFSHLEELTRKPETAEFSAEHSHHRAETTSLMMKEILSHGPPEPRWGINE